MKYLLCLTVGLLGAASAMASPVCSGEGYSVTFEDGKALVTLPGETTPLIFQKDDCKGEVGCEGNTYGDRRVVGQPGSEEVQYYPSSSPYAAPITLNCR